MPEEKKAKPDKAAKAAAAKLAARQEAAENAFAEADVDGSGNVDAKELEGLLIKLLQREGVPFERHVVSEFVAAEFAKADTDGSGDVDWDEFIAYFNGLLDRLAGGAMNDALAEAKKATAKKLEEAAIAEDDGVYAHLHTLVAILSSPSVKAYSGMEVAFKLKSRNAESTPVPEHGATSHGLILDLSRRAQRLLTPWGSLPIGYRLSFEGYQEKVPAEEEGGKKKVKKGAVPWPLVPVVGGENEKHPMFFLMSRPPPKVPPGVAPPPPPLLRVKKLPLRCHYMITEIQGEPVPIGEVFTPDAASGEPKKLAERWATLLKRPKDPVVQLPADDVEGGPLVNMICGATVAVRQDKFESLKRRKEVTARTGNKKFTEDDMIIALLNEKNDDAAAAKMLIKMQSSENTVLDRRAGHATRAMVRYALATCEYDADHAEWMLKNQDKLLKKLCDKIYEQSRSGNGIPTALGYPTRVDIERQLVYKRADEGPVLAELKRIWKPDIEAMTEIIAAAEIEEMLTPERCESFAYSRPVSAEEAAHTQELYLSEEFGRDREATIKFLSEAGSVLKRSATLGAPSRKEVEDCLRELECDSERVLAFLQAWSNMSDIAPKQGVPGPAVREDCKRYLTLCDRNEANATELLKSVWKLANPKEPKPPPKGSKKPPQEWYSQKCGFPERFEAEWALLGTRLSNKEGKPLMIDAAVELLTKLSNMTEERRASPANRADVLWALDADRTAVFLKTRGLTKEEKGAAESPATVILAAIETIIASTTASGVKIQRSELYAALEKFAFDAPKAERWLNGVGTLMTRQTELGIVAREEVEVAMEYHELDDAKVIELFNDAAELQKRKLELGNPSRDEIKAMLTLAWESENRIDVTAACLSFYRTLMSDDSQLMTLFGNSPAEAERVYIRKSILRFKGDPTKSMEYLKNVAEIEGKGEALGSPSRDEIISRLDEAGLDKRKATQAIREEYHTRRDLQLKEEYKRNKEAAEAKKSSA